MNNQDYREYYRRMQIPPNYSSKRHRLVAFVFPLISCFLCFFFARHLTLTEALITVSLTFVYANLIEYLVHRYIMHVKRPGLEIVYRRHTLEHHRFFTKEHILITDPHDYHILLFPPVMLLLFFGGVALPTSLLIGYFFDQDIALTFAGTAFFYYFTYEILHTISHLPDGHPLFRFSLIKSVRSNHLNHHDPKKMHLGFNVTFPLWDLFFKTIAR